MTAARSQVSSTALFAAPGEPPRPVQFGYQALLDGHAVIRRLARELPAAAADLIEIAATVYVVDQQVARPRRQELDSGSTWARELRVEIPVRRPEIWSALNADLGDLLAWLTDVQERVLREMNAVSRHACVPLRYRVSTRGQKHAAESSQRSRGLLFLAAGIATAWTLRHDRLQVFENGIGAVNLPYVHSQFGSQAAKAMHPRTLHMAQALASAVSGRPFRIDAPGMTATKAQLIRRAPAAADRALAGTVSCDTGFSARVPRHAPCGTCTSCILRRQALHAAGKAHLDAEAGYRASSPEKSVQFQVMLWQVSRLRDCLGQPDPWRALVSEYPELLDTAPLAPAEVIGLYRSYVKEWEDLPEAFRPQIGRTAAS
jgi:hypothetical protein